MPLGKYDPTWKAEKNADGSGVISVAKSGVSTDLHFTEGAVEQIASTFGAETEIDDSVYLVCEPEAMSYGFKIPLGAPFEINVREQYDGKITVYFDDEYNESDKRNWNTDGHDTDFERGVHCRDDDLSISVS